MIKKSTKTFYAKAGKQQSLHQNRHQPALADGNTSSLPVCSRHLHARTAAFAMETAGLFLAQMGWCNRVHNGFAEAGLAFHASSASIAVSYVQH